ncbi:C2H2 finger domain-containing protein [Diplocarpon rosae]|nr:C2H2 finger domain-containing protein [Diplocarpon rosae]
MSSTYQSTPASVDPRSSKDLDDPRLHHHHLPSTTFDSTLLWPLIHSHTISNSTTPSYIAGESLSGYSNDQSEFDGIDPFFGVNFDDDVQRIDSPPTTAIFGTVADPSADLDPRSPGLPIQAASYQPSATFSKSIYPLSPIHSSMHSTPSTSGAGDKTENKSTNSHDHPITGLRKSRFLALQKPAAVQLTPDSSGSSHTSAEGLEPSSMPQSPRPMVPPSSQQSSLANRLNFGGALPVQAQYQDSASAIQREECGLWWAGEETGRAGMDPESRQVVAGVEVPTLKEQEESRRVEHRNSEVNEWRCQAGGSSNAVNEQSVQSCLPINHDNWYLSGSPGNHPTHDLEDSNVHPVDDGASLHENRLVHGQSYFDLNSTHINDADKAELTNHTRHWKDAPSIPYIIMSSHQPPTSNEAMRRFNQHADSFSIVSRVATWGTRRRSEPSLADFDGVSDGSFLKKLSIISKSRDERPRQNSIFDQSFDRLASFARKRSDSKLKRVRSTQHIPEDTQPPQYPRHDSQDTLVPPVRTPSFSKRQTPSINTAFAAMAGPLAAVGTTHTRHTSFGASATSPKSPVHLGFAKSVILRARSRSELSSQDKAGQTGLVSLWRGQGGPPVLATPPALAEAKLAQQEIFDNDEDEEDDEQAEDYEPGMELEQEADLIVPNYEGFKAHLRLMNPAMDPRHDWLVSRIANQQEIRYKNLLDLRVKHLQAISSRDCSAGPHCSAWGGSITLADAAKGNVRDKDHTAGRQSKTEFSDEEFNPGGAALTDETFPPGVPMPPSRNLPAEFECSICFKTKKIQKPSDWTKHVHEDVQPFTCTYDKCKEPKSFKRKADWVRHENERHRHLEWWVCQVGDCQHPCYRKDNFLQHLVREHKLPEPKQNTKAAIKKARTTEPVWIMLERCHNETQNRPQDEPCKFCGTIFPTWKRLTVHLAKHMEQLSLPILRLVEANAVDANTTISPVAQSLTLATPVSHAKAESHSAFDMGSVSPRTQMTSHLASTGFEQLLPFQTTGLSVGYGMLGPAPQEVNYSNTMYSHAFGSEQMGQQPRSFKSIDLSNLGCFEANGAFDPSDSGFPPKVEAPERFGPMDSGLSHTVTDQNYNMQQTSVFSIPQTFSTTPPIPNYPVSDMLGVSDARFGFDTIITNGGQQAPLNGVHGSASPSTHPAQTGPYNLPFDYGNSG